MTDHRVFNDELPVGWATAPVAELCELVRGVSYVQGEESNAPKDGYIPLLRANNINGLLVFNDLRYVPPRRVSPEQMLRLGDVVVAMSSGSKAVVGKTAMLDHEWKGTFGAFCGVLRPCSGLDSRYFALFFRTEQYRDFISEASAGVNINNLKRDHFAQINLPIPPVEEQRRIAHHVGELLTRVNCTRDQLLRVPAIVKRFRQAVLSAACSGKLTEDWRKQSTLATARGFGVTIEPYYVDESLPELPEGWKWQKLGDTAKVERGRFLVRPRNDPAYYGGQHPFVQIGDLPSNGGEIPSYEQSLNDKGLGVSKCFPKGTVLIAIVGATIGNTGVLTFDSCCPDSIVAIQANSEAMSRFVEYYLRWKKLEVRNESYASGGQPNINLQTLIPLPVPVPPAHEVEVIVCRVEVLFRLAEEIERRVAVTNHKCDLLEKAILAKAFRGELVPTEAELARREGRDYEPASVLLERIKAERITEMKPSRTKRGMRKASVHV
jgi:type I restriction enzyme, S subunit